MNIEYTGTSIGCQFRPLAEQETLFKLCESIEVGKPCPMNIGLAREPNNPHDPNAVSVFLWDENDETYHVGYCPRDRTDEARDFLDWLKDATTTHHVTKFESFIETVKYDDGGLVKWFSFRLSLSLEKND